VIPARTFNTHPLTSLILTASLGLGAIGSAQAATYYVRTDGGDASQCTGRGDAPYPGSGTAQNCAWKNPNIALPASGTVRIVGGDTLLIGSGTYQIGSGGQMLPIPSGTTTARTRILGKAGATAPKLAGINGIHRVLNLEGSSNIELGNLEITDQSDCVYNHSVSAAACSSSMPWARVGVYARASSNVWMHDVNIHGMAKNAVNAGGLTNWTMERVKFNKNGSAGWDGNVGTSGSNAGNIIMRDIEIGWNGCGERVSTGEPWACWAQQTGGYGDGFGTTDTGGKWLIEDAFIHHNTSDGLDLRYMDGADGTHVTLRRVYSVANAGNQVKIKGSSLIENSVLVGHCTYFKGKFYMVDGDHCRAYGSTVLLVMTGNDTAVLRHNTLAGEGDVLVGYAEGSSSDKISLLNNTAVGFPYYRDTSVLTVFSGGGAPAAKTFSGNLAWKVRSCPSGATCVDPKLTNMALASFDAEPLSGSPVIDKAPMISAVTTDFVMGQRPWGVANDIGAYEFGASGTSPTPTPTPTCTVAAPTLSLTGPTTAVAAGTTNTYTLALRNNDSSGCANTSFSLARTVPTGWTGTLSATSVNLAPGASSNTTLSVTSANGTTAGTYNIGVGASSSVGSTHAVSATATYSVKDVEAVEGSTLTESVGTDKTSYVRGETVYMSARVLKDGLPLSGAAVRFGVLKPDGTQAAFDAVTDSNGFARSSFKSGKGMYAVGGYTLVADATSGTLTAMATWTFSVVK